ncbi:unnamed protein product [Acanthoscelides obtectus]|uniref:Uncharacterized protein n=1 Tax=Acanthoscelides obtectus TaxID=200917 RepID=A0A9P0LPJ9_ACAOB|nr:unnamed protein product [Acanthoscelides obtectus]CAK1621967.1 hypothetical protein AOBTE_LOCUS1242 [Acanthoscelides obtectus]
MEEDQEDIEDETSVVEQNTPTFRRCFNSTDLHGLGEYKTIRDMMVETSLDVDRIVDDDIGKYLNKEVHDDIEDSERPGTSSMRNIDVLIEGETVEHFVNQCNGFYEEMKLKVSSLRRTPDVNNLTVKPKKNMDEGDIFKNIQHTPDVQKRLDAINKLDFDIRDIINTYKVERAARMEAQLEMCNELSQYPDCRERDSEKFLEVCQFELSQCGSDSEDDENGGSLENSQQQQPKVEARFVRRNVALAREGYLAGCSLTDEEKSKIEGIMTVKDDDSDGKQKSKTHFTNANKTTHEQTYTHNAYKFEVDQSQKMKEIDTELEKFALDEKNTEKYVSGLPKSYEETGSICLLKKEIAIIEAKLKELRNRDGEEMEKNKERFLELQKKWKQEDEQEEKEFAAQEKKNDELDAMLEELVNREEEGIEKDKERLLELQKKWKIEDDKEENDKEAQERLLELQKKWKEEDEREELNLNTGDAAEQNEVENISEAKIDEDEPTTGEYSNAFQLVNSAEVL